MDQFDPNIPGYIEGGITAVTIAEPGGLGVSNRVIDPSKDFTVQVDWNVSGPLTPLWIAALNDPWVVSVYAESMAGGPEALVGTAQVLKADHGPGWQYTAKVVVPANTLVEGNPGSQVSGIYKLVTSVFLDSTLGAPGFDMIGSPRARSSRSRTRSDVRDG